MQDAYTLEKQLVSWILEKYNADMRLQSDKDVASGAIPSSTLKSNIRTLLYLLVLW